MGPPESDLFSTQQFSKAESLKFAAGGRFNVMIDIMVFHTIHVIMNPLFIFRHLSFCLLFMKMLTLPSFLSVL